MYDYEEVLYEAFSCANKNVGFEWEKVGKVRKTITQYRYRVPQIVFSPSLLLFD